VVRIYKETSHFDVPNKQSKATDFYLKPLLILILSVGFSSQQALAEDETMAEQSQSSVGSLSATIFLLIEENLEKVSAIATNLLNDTGSAFSGNSTNGNTETCIATGGWPRL